MSLKYWCSVTKADAWLRSRMWASTYTMTNVSHNLLECQYSHEYEIIKVTAINTKNTGWRANVHCSHPFVCLSCRACCFLSTWSFFLLFVLSMPSAFKCCQLQVYPSHVCTYLLAGIARRMCERMNSACNNNNNNYNVILMFFYKSVLSVMIYLDTVEARIGANYLLTWLRLFVPVCSPYNKCATNAFRWASTIEDSKLIRTDTDSSMKVHISVAASASTSGPESAAECIHTLTQRHYRPYPMAQIKRICQSKIILPRTER